MKHYEVVCAVIKNDKNEIFCCQRGKGQLKGFWEFPGGKVEPNETYEQTIVREIKEELESVIEPIKYIGKSTYEYKNLDIPFGITLYAFECKLVSGDLVLKEHSDSKWLRASDLSLLNFAEADKFIIKEIIKKEVKKEVSEQKSVAKCIACGKETKPGFLFCPSCYKKYVDKKLLVEITNCREITILDDSYEGKFTCTDGHIVKSKSEMIIDNWLFDHNIPHAYEKKLPIDADENHDLHPDFFLPGYGNDPDGIYIEYWGYNEKNLEYTKSKNYKMKIYKELKITVICLEEKDIMDINTSLSRKLKFYKKGLINE